MATRREVKFVSLSSRTCYGFFHGIEPFKFASCIAPGTSSSSSILSKLPHQMREGSNQRCSFVMRASLVRGMREAAKPVPFPFRGLRLT